MKGITKYYQGKELDSIHTEDMCDRCQKDVGRKNLKALPFIYCNLNDKLHPDISHLYGLPKGAGYRLYEVCKDCYEIEK